MDGKVRIFATRKSSVANLRQKLHSIPKGEAIYGKDTHLNLTCV